MKRLLCVRLPHWPIQRLVVAQPELQGRAVILHARDPRRGLCVAACSHLAAERGIRPGLPLAEALAWTASAEQDSSAVDSTIPPARPAESVGRAAIAQPPRRTPATETADPFASTSPASEDAAASHERAPHLAAYDPAADAAALQQLATWCERFSPVVGFEPLEDLTDTTPWPPPRSDCLYLDVTHLGTYFGGESQLARQVATSFSQLGYQVRVALADTLGAAWACARCTLEHTVVETVSAGGRVRAVKDSSFRVVPAGATIQALEPLPPAALRLPGEVLSLLRQLGITRIAQLAALPRASLSSRFGEVLLQRWDQACGDLDEPLVTHHPEPVFQVTRQLEYPIAHRATIESLVQELLEQLTALLRTRGEGVLQCTCRLTCSSSSQNTSSCSPLAPTIVLPVGLYQPTACPEHLRQLFGMQLERALLPGPVQQMVVEALLTAPLERRQRVLFADTTRPDPYQLAQLLDRLSSRLGSGNVVRASLQTEAQPELAYCYLPLTGVGARRFPAARRSTRRSTANAETSAATSARPAQHVRRSLIRPLHLRSPPLPLQVLALAPDGPPVQLFFGQRTFRVVRAWGPERLETGWWRGRSLRRDYYRLETACGHWLWVFHRLQDGRWFLHGMFG